ncbi:MAG UNVERIFIED_CONTAM: hypothetical protein LVQ98_09170 [Rickettsiaceae bacterium]
MLRKPEEAKALLSPVADDYNKAKALNDAVVHQAEGRGLLEPVHQLHLMGIKIQR